MPAGLKSSLIQKRIRASENRLAVAPTISGGFSSKRYRKSTRLVQEYPVTGWISRRWEARQNPGCSDKTLTPAITSEGDKEFEGWAATGEYQRDASKKRRQEGGAVVSAARHRAV
jgi:hypothetical protein